MRAKKRKKAGKKVVKRTVDLTKPRKLSKKLYKVLHPRIVSGSLGLPNKTIYTGGNTPMDWTPYLPQNGQPGKPATVGTRKKLILCQYGLHVTSSPRRWGNLIEPGKARVFEVKVFGPVEGDPHHSDKICAYKVQLVREIIDKRLALPDNSEWEAMSRL